MDTDRDRELQGRAAEAVQLAMWWLSSRRGTVTPTPLEIEREATIELVDTVRRVRSPAWETPDKPPTDRLGLLHFEGGVAVHVKQVWLIDPENPDAEPVLHNVRHEWRQDKETEQWFQETIFLGAAEPEKPRWQPLLVGLILKAKAAMLAWERGGKVDKDPTSLDWSAPASTVEMNTLGCRAHSRHVIEDARMLCQHNGTTLPAWITEKVVRIVLARASFQSGGAGRLSEAELIKLFRSHDHFARRIREFAESLVSRWSEHDERRARPMSKRKAHRALSLLMEVADEVQGIQRTEQDRFKARLADIQAKPTRSKRDREIVAMYRLLGKSRPRSHSKVDGKELIAPYRHPEDQPTRPEVQLQRLPGKQRLWANSQLRNEQTQALAGKPQDSLGPSYESGDALTPSVSGTPIPEGAGAFSGAPNATQQTSD